MDGARAVLRSPRWLDHAKDAVGFGLGSAERLATTRLLDTNLPECNNGFVAVLARDGWETRCRQLPRCSQRSSGVRRKGKRLRFARSDAAAFTMRDIM